MSANNVAAEKALLGAVMSDAHAYKRAAAYVQPADFYLVRHETIWRALGTLDAQGIPGDPVLVADLLAKTDGAMNLIGGHVYLAECYGAAGSEGSVEYMAEIIADAATARRIEQAGQRMVQRATQEGVDPLELVQWASEQVAGARNERVGVDRLTQSYEDFMRALPEDRPMVIPGLLGEQDRLVLTGHGGLGKSTLLLQIALCAAAGVPPLDWASQDTFEPVKVSIYDFENADHRLKTRMYPIVRHLRERFECDPVPNLTIGGHGNPLNLLNPQNALSLLRSIEHDEPKLVYLGPVYKMHNDDPDKEIVVKKITDVMDSVRAMGCAIITEAHHTKEGRKGGTLEPSGSNLWTWWPEFGLGLRLGNSPEADIMRQCLLERWRVDRDANGWPHAVEASGIPGLPWVRTAALNNQNGWDD